MPSRARKFAASGRSVDEIDREHRERDDAEALQRGVWLEALRTAVFRLMDLLLSLRSARGIANKEAS